MNPSYPVYVISKGRWESRLTVKALEKMGVPYHVVVEPQEFDQYASVIDPAKIFTLPFSNIGQGSIPARNWVWEHAISVGERRHWILDDNIDGFYRLNHNLKVPVASGTMFKVVEDSSRCSVASADYLLVFRKRGTNPAPIAHPHGLMDYAGERKVPAELLKYRGWKGNQIENRYSHWIWRQYASAFWDDIRIGRVLPFLQAKEEEDEKHVHPLQLDVIERCLVLWSNLGETVLTPFMGVGSEVCGALVNGRRGIGIELKPSYYRQAQRNIAALPERGWGDAENRELFAEQESVTAD